MGSSLREYDPMGHDTFLNIMVGYLLLRLPLQETTNKWVSWLALLGMLMPVGILAELLLGAPPLFVLIGAASMIASVTWLGIAIAKLKSTDSA